VAESILVADDDVLFRDRLAKELRRRGHHVVAAGNYDEALREIVVEGPRYAVLDLRLDDRSGLEVLEELNARVPGARAVVVTGYGAIVDAVEAVRLGACDFVCKPVDPDALLMTLLEKQVPPAKKPKAPSLALVEWEHIARTLADCGGNVTHAAKRLGIDRRSLQRKLKRGRPLQ
jgi:two-component system response regulator RegA